MEKPVAERLKAFVPAFSTCMNELFRAPPVVLCRLSLCRKLLNASTKYWVATATVAKSGGLVAETASNKVEAESSFPAAEMFTVSVPEGVAGGKTACCAPMAETVSRFDGAVTDEMSMMMRTKLTER